MTEKVIILSVKNTNSIKNPTVYLSVKGKGSINKIQRLPVRVQNFSRKRHGNSWKEKPVTTTTTENHPFQ